MHAQLRHISLKGMPTKYQNAASELMRVARLGDVEKLKQMLASKDVTANTEMGVSGSSALHVAAEYDQAEVVRVLVENKADPNMESRCAEAPLIIAAMKGNEEIVKLLLAAGADPRIWNHEHRSVVTLAKTKEIAKIVSEARASYTPSGAAA